ncbi:MAG TPA: type III pantothenate kinase [Rhodanobacteraceae bacterium]|nr:type III pantothenate kinase [Rhodanobacteraceae bacterium]
MSAAHPETWLFDLGNSRAKAARLDRGEPSDILALEWEHPDFVAALRAGLERWPAPARVWIASVASAGRAAKIRDALDSIPVEHVEWLRSPRSAGGVINRYAKPDRLGIDRFLAMLAAHRRADGGCIVIGCGTALTLDAVAADGTHAEGMIALSPERMLQTLHAATAIADRNPDAFAADVRDDTALALHAGCWASAGALVEWFVARARKNSGAEHVWLHGGWAAYLAEWLAQDGCGVEVLDDAVLRGLATWAAEADVESPARGR